MDNYNKIKCNIFLTVCVASEYQITVISIDEEIPLRISNCNFNKYKKEIKECNEWYDIYNIFILGVNEYYCDKIYEDLKNNFNINIIKSYKGEK